VKSRHNRLSREDKEHEAIEQRVNYMRGTDNYQMEEMPSNEK